MKKIEKMHEGSKLEKNGMDRSPTPPLVHAFRDFREKTAQYEKELKELRDMSITDFEDYLSEKISEKYHGTIRDIRDMERKKFVRQALGDNFRDLPDADFDNYLKENVPDNYQNDARDLRDAERKRLVRQAFGDDFGRDPSKLEGDKEIALYTRVMEPHLREIHRERREALEKIDRLTKTLEDQKEELKKMDENDKALKQEIDALQQKMDTVLENIGAEQQTVNTL